MSAINVHGNELEFRSAVDAAAQEAMRAELRIHETYARQLLEAEGLDPELAGKGGCEVILGEYRLVHEMQAIDPSDGIHRTAHQIRLYKLVDQTSRYTVDVDLEPRLTLTLPDRDVADLLDRLET